MLGFSDWDSHAVHLLGLVRDVVEDFALRRDRLLPAERPMARDEQRVFA
jgi:hypothetical protein